MDTQISLQSSTYCPSCLGDYQHLQRRCRLLKVTPLGVATPLTERGGRREAQLGTHSEGPVSRLLRPELLLDFSFLPNPASLPIIAIDANLLDKHLPQKLPQNLLPEEQTCATWGFRCGIISI